MRPVDKLVGGYLAFLTAFILLRWNFWAVETWMLLAMHLLVFVLIYLTTNVKSRDTFGGVVRDIYPLLLLPTLYTELGILAMQRDLSDIFANDLVIQGWETTIFGGQLSRDWIRNSPSVFWSGILHLAYLAYYPILLSGPILLVVRRKADAAHNVLFATMFAFVVCYLVFALFPVAGPNYVFDHPTGPVREVWSARLVYGLLGSGSAIGTAFPSSHVAATVAANFALWKEWRALAGIILIPTILLVVGTVYCQMHYGIDASAGLFVGLTGGWIGKRIVSNPHRSR